MNPELYAWLIGGIAGGVAIASWPAEADAAPRPWPSVACLGGLIGALLLVGTISGTMIRHLMQVTPAAAAIVLVAVHSPHGRAAVLPIVLFWIALMLTIWGYLLGFTRVIGGHFTTAEIVLTIAIAVACVVGLIGGARPTANLPPSRRALTAIAFGLLQLAAFWASLQPFAILR